LSARENRKSIRHLMLLYTRPVTCKLLIFYEYMIQQYTTSVQWERLIPPVRVIILSHNRQIRVCVKKRICLCEGPASRGCVLYIIHKTEIKNASPSSSERIYVFSFETSFIYIILLYTIYSTSIICIIYILYG